MTNSKKDSELEEILRIYSIAVQELHAGVVPFDDGIEAGRWRAEALQAINSKYITKEESDRRVLEGRLSEANIFGNWNADAGIVELWDVIERRTAELRELLKGDKK